MRAVIFVVRTVDKLSQLLGKILSPIVLFLMAVIVYDVTKRYVLSHPTLWVQELSEFIFGAYWLLGGAYTLLEEAHVKMDVFYRRFSVRTRAVIDVITAPIFFVFIVILLREGWHFASFSLRCAEHSNSMWSPPLYPAKMMIPMAALLMLLQGMTKFVRALVLAITGREL